MKKMNKKVSTIIEVAKSLFNIGNSKKDKSFEKLDATIQEASKNTEKLVEVFKENKKKENDENESTGK